MSRAFLTLASMLPCSLAVAGGVYLAANDREGWAWAYAFALAVLLSPRISFSDKTETST